MTAEISTRVRPFAPEDREAVMRIAADTAFFGEPIEIFMEDRRIFQDVFYSYYTDMEPQHAWVACLQDQVVGFLTGCVDTRAHDQMVKDEINPRAWKKLLRGGYRVGPKFWRFVGGMLWTGLAREGAPTPLDLYPAHLHINLDAAARGLGLGKGLMTAYLTQLRQEGLPGVHLHTSSQNQTACRMYESFGFRLIAAHPTRLWRPYLAEPVESRCYALDLREPRAG